MDTSTLRTSTKLAGFAASLLAVLGLGVGLGAAIGPDITRADDEAPAPVGEGITSSAEGYRLVPEQTRLAAEGGPLHFVIEDREGAPTRRYTEVHERDLHLIVVNRELTVFHHLHPTLGSDGAWTIDVPALEPGAYRAVADFQVADGPRLALGTDLSVAGTYRPEELGEPTSQSEVNGYDVTLTTDGDDGTVTATLTVRSDGDPVDLEPYLGARGHLVAMRTGDLAYAHVHPVDDGDADGDAMAGVVTFDAELPSAGRYALFFDFKHDGEVRTASFVVDQGQVSGTDEMEH
jgi:hypothetical protein